MNENEKAVAAVLAKYQDAMNASDTDALLRLYAPDGILMAQHFPTSVGTAAVRQAYESVFKAFTLSVNFPIAEVRELSPEWVIARTNSNGTVKVHASGASAPVTNQELFVFQKIDGQWKIARYCFCNTNPPRA